MIAGDTHIGGRTENQDAFGFLEESQFGLIAVVCDGMGGMAGGAQAAHQTFKTVLEGLAESKLGDPQSAIFNTVFLANAKLHAFAQDHPELRGMGTTVTVLILQKGKAYLGHVGDSRIYQYRRGKQIFRTWDHSVVFEMLREGILKNEEEARNHERANELVQAIGVKPTVEVETRVLDYEKGDRFLLCTDGICGSLSDEAMAQRVRQAKDPKELVAQLIKDADGYGEEQGGGHDNMTLVVVEVEEGPVGGSEREDRAAQASTGGGGWRIGRRILVLTLVLVLGLGAFAGWLFMKTRAIEAEALEAREALEVLYEKEIGIWKGKFEAGQDSLAMLQDSAKEMEAAKKQMDEKVIRLEVLNEVVDRVGEDSVAQRYFLNWLGAEEEVETLEEWVEGQMLEKENGEAENSEGMEENGTSTENGGGDGHSLR